MSEHEYSEQEKFWAEEYGKVYLEKHHNFNRELGVEVWKQILRKAEAVDSILECGCGGGRNIMFLNEIMPLAQKSIIEISKPVFDYTSERYKLKHAFNGSILESDFQQGSFDLVFSIGVLIHINPDQLLANMGKMFGYSNKYILFGEYFNKTPVMIEYQDRMNQLFKRDYGKLFLQNFKVRIVDYGFVWSQLYGSAGFDDIVWWFFEKH